MQINTIDNQNFGARIKISKKTVGTFRDAAIMSGAGTSLSASGVMSSLPASDPIHHIHIAAKVIDGVFATVGSAFFAGGSVCAKFAQTLFKNAFKKPNIPS